MMMNCVLHFFIKEIKNGKQLMQIDKKVVDTKIEKGIAELNNGLGKDFGIFLNEAKAICSSQSIDMLRSKIINV
jgi:hypothetical protein